MYCQVESLVNSTGFQVPEDKPSLPPEGANAENHRPEYRLNAVHDSSENNADRTPSGTNGAHVSNMKDANESSAENDSANQHVKTEGLLEVIEQFEPGVYVTLIQLSNGTKIYKRVRFRYVCFR